MPTASLLDLIRQGPRVAVSRTLRTSSNFVIKDSFERRLCALHSSRGPGAAKFGPRLGLGGIRRHVPRTSCRSSGRTAGLVGSESGLISGPESGRLSGHTRSRVLSGVSRVPLGSESGPRKIEKSEKRTREDPSRVGLGSVGSLGGEESWPLHLTAYLSASSSPGGSSGCLSNYIRSKHFRS